MPAKSTKSNGSGKPATSTSSLLLSENNGTTPWYWQIDGKQYYFGTVRTDPDGTEALKRYDREMPYLREGRSPPPVDTELRLPLRPCSLT